MTKLNKKKFRVPDPHNILYTIIKSKKLNYNTTQQVGSDSRLPKSLIESFDIQVA